MAPADMGPDLAVAAIDLLSHPGWQAPRLPLRAAELPAPPQPGFFMLKTRRVYNPVTGTTPFGKWIMPALIYRPCPWIQPDDLPYAPGAPDPEDWCRRTARSRPLRAMIGGTPCERGSLWDDPCSAAQMVWDLGKDHPISARQYEDALREYAEYQLR
jgi:hypothetical protein